MELFYLEQVDSTNKYAKNNIDKFTDMTVVYTSIQTSGRGRLQRTWNFMGEENIYASIILKPTEEYKEIYSNLTQYLCLILAETFEEYNIIPKIKWPNDILVNNKKISGILAESVIVGSKLKGLVLGFGVNLNCNQEKLDLINQPATSLDIETGMKIDRDIFLNKILDKFCLRYNEFIEEGFLLIKEDYKKRAGFLDKAITVKVFDENFVGIAKDITDSGALKILDKNNKEHVLLIGDIL